MGQQERARKARAAARKSAEERAAVWEDIRVTDAAMSAQERLDEVLRGATEYLDYLRSEDEDPTVAAEKVAAWMEEQMDEYEKERG